MNRGISELKRPILCLVPKISTRSFTGSSILQGSKAVRFLKSQRRRQDNEAKQSKLKNVLDDVDPVLGRPETPFIDRIMAELKEPSVLASGYNKTEVERLFASVEATKHEELNLSTMNANVIEKEDLASIDERREAIFRILSMKNSNQKDSMKLAIRLAREEFQRFPGDTGSSEVQAACMTVRIQKLADHIKDNHKDFANIRVLRILTQQRQSILKYLKRDDPKKYYWTIQKLGLSDNAITTEFNMDRRYMQDYKFYGDKILIKESKKKAEERRRETRRQKKAEKNARRL
ncbi:hypothetical protein Kpol_1055p16 [Vanderwaltozyma polyspora DSM 70294]|uniref:37S ribosomal protein S28, mitochondrial n=1 Tax=Vanderwaltozyma polyspora (strain ATCC 22028 / DSM 70294 / BCRC 21397 / CBS 2163 / NBRC 10782 / NRRL Y-8283 / UCD 57-17) TaxID=436907 RepID=A7TG90_VANPO|nr:uncharacterized protein Kpol_1055p16 [Vanderwaltozyma polyspora DSM 70294]EDO18660.1 hypothetical protein Kpol_1055p16 [Vanderwaltozyma polyspora DSM 70294]